MGVRHVCNIPCPPVPCLSSRYAPCMGEMGDMGDMDHTGDMDHMDDKHG